MSKRQREDYVYLTNNYQTFTDNKDITNVIVDSHVTSIQNRAFLGCTSLASIDIPEGVISIGYSAFLGCVSFTNVTIPGSVTSIGNQMFWGCSSLTSVTMPNSISELPRSTFVRCYKLGLFSNDDINFPAILKNYKYELLELTLKKAIENLNPLVDIEEKINVISYIFSGKPIADTAVHIDPNVIYEDILSFLPEFYLLIDNSLFARLISVRRELAGM